MTDGTENYTGVELSAAKTGLDSFDNFDDGIGTYPSFSKQRVTAITYTPRDKCTDRNDESSYSYTLESVSWFGIKVGEKTDSICRMFGGWQ